MQLNLKLLFTEVLVMSVLRGKFGLLLLDVLTEDICHTGVHPMNCLTTAALFTILLSILALSLLLDSALEHGSAHLRHLLLLFRSDSVI